MPNVSKKLLLKNLERLRRVPREVLFSETPQVTQTPQKLSANVSPYR